MKHFRTIPRLAICFLFALPVLVMAQSFPKEKARSYYSDVTGIGFELFQRGYSEFEATKTRQFDENRFIPSEITSYPDDSVSSQKIILLLRYRHGGEVQSDERAKEICTQMINWTRFHLGVKNNGGYVDPMRPFEASSMFRFVRAANPKDETQAYASSLDSAVLILANVIQMPHTPATTGNASCKAGLIP